MIRVELNKATADLAGPVPDDTLLAVDEALDRLGDDRRGRLSCNEAEPSSRDATARAWAFPSLSGRARPHPLKGRLHGFRSLTMVNTFQLTGTTKLCLALSEPHTNIWSMNLLGIDP
jgi:hypothetical protein